MSPIRRPKKVEVYSGNGKIEKIDATDLVALAKVGDRVDRERKKLNEGFSVVKKAVLGQLRPTERTRELDGGITLSVTAPTKPGDVDPAKIREGLLAAVKAKKIDRASVDAAVPELTVVGCDGGELKKLADLGIPEVTLAIEAGVGPRKKTSQTLTIDLPDPEQAKAA